MMIDYSSGKVATIDITKEITAMVELLPENEQSLVFELIKRVVLAWDSDFTKLTPAERQRLEIAEQDYLSGKTISHDDIDWS